MPNPYLNSISFQLRWDSTYISLAIVVKGLTIRATT